MPTVVQHQPTPATIPGPVAGAPGDDPGAAGRWRRTGGAAALVAAPLLLVVGAAIHPTEADDGAAQLAVVDGAAGRWLLAHTLLVAGAVLLIPAFFALARRLRPVAPGWGLAGTILGVGGAPGLVGLFALDGFAASRLAGLADRPAAALAYERLAAAAIPFGALALASSLGVAVLGIGFLRAGGAPRPTAIGLLAGGVALTVGMAGELGPVAAAGQLSMALAMIAVAVSDLRDAS